MSKKSSTSKIVLKLDENFELILAEYQRTRAVLPKLSSDFSAEVSLADRIAVSNMIEKVKEILTK